MEKVKLKEKENRKGGRVMDDFNHYREIFINLNNEENDILRDIDHAQSYEHLSKEDIREAYEEYGYDYKFFNDETEKRDELYRELMSFYDKKGKQSFDFIKDVNSGRVSDDNIFIVYNSENDSYYDKIIIDLSRRPDEVEKGFEGAYKKRFTIIPPIIMEQEGGAEELYEFLSKHVKYVSDRMQDIDAHPDYGIEELETARTPFPWRNEKLLESINSKEQLEKYKKQVECIVNKYTKSGFITDEIMDEINQINEELERRVEKQTNRYSFEEFITQTKNEIRRPIIVMGDGVSMSVQASSYHYCFPKLNNLSAYREYEIGYPSEIIEKLIDYVEYPVESEDEYLHRVYPYVPADLISEIIEEHGGIDKEATFEIKEKLSAYKDEKSELERKNKKAMELINQLMAQIGNLMEDSRND